MIEETGDDEELFAAAAERYARNLAGQVETLVVIPFWEEIERFNGHARSALRRAGVTPTQAVNMLYAQIERRKAIPFPVAVEDNSDVVPPIEHVARVWGELDQEDFSHLVSRSR